MSRHTGAATGGAAVTTVALVAVWLGAVGRAVASLLVLVVGAAGAVGTVGVGLALLGSFFPVPTADEVPSAGLLLVSQAGLVAACMTAALGLALGVGGPLDRGSLGRYYRVSLATAAVPLGVALVAGGVAVLGALAAGRSVTLGGLVAGLVGWLVAPEAASGPRLGSLLLLVALAALSLRAAVGALPVAELLADAGLGRTRADEVRRLRRWCLPVAAVTGLAAPVGALVGLRLTSAGVAELLGPGNAAVLTALTTSPAVRVPLAATVAAGSAVALLAWLLRRVAAGGSSAAARVAPLAAGAAVAGLAILLGGAVLEALVAAVAGRLPGPFADGLREITGAVVDFYGAGSVVVALAAVLCCLTALAVLVLRVAVWTGYLGTQTAGFGLAAAGLLAAATFAGTLGAPALVVFVGVAGSLAVWEAGEFATVLGEEVGSVPSRDVELVHLGGTAAVGAVGVGAAFGLRRVLAGATLSGSGAALALLTALAGLVALVVALR